MNLALKLFSSLSGSLKGGSVSQSLTQLARDRAPVRLEVEHSEASFYTVLSPRPQGVLLGRPGDLENGILKVGGHVRFTLPDGSGNVIRMRILKPNVRRKATSQFKPVSLLSGVIVSVSSSRFSPVLPSVCSTS